VTATLATFFVGRQVGRQAQDANAEVAGAQAIRELQAEISALRCGIGELSRRGNPSEES